MDNTTRKIDLQAEKNFENKRARGGDIRKNQEKFYYATSIPINRYQKQTFKKISNKIILEIGCSSGEGAKLYTNFSSYYCGIDISDEAIKNAKNLNLKNSEFKVEDGHKISKRDAEFDCIIVNSTLHHMDLNHSFREIYRVLKDDGCLIFREPLGINPIFKIYRKLTPCSRTPDERAFTLKDIELMKKFFYFNEVQYFGFFSILSGFLRFKFLKVALTSFDSLLSKTPLKYLFWQFSGFCKKKI